MLLKLTRTDGSMIIRNSAEIKEIDHAAEDPKYPSAKTIIRYFRVLDNGKPAFDFVQESMDEVAKRLGL